MHNKAKTRGHGDGLQVSDPKEQCILKLVSERRTDKEAKELTYMIQEEVDQRAWKTKGRKAHTAWSPHTPRLTFESGLAQTASQPRQHDITIDTHLSQIPQYAHTFQHTSVEGINPALFPKSEDEGKKSRRPPRKS